MMSKWISADSIINMFNSHVGFTTCADVKRAIKLIQDEPGIDIVICKECKFREANKSIYRGAWYCSNHGDTVDLDDFCSYGERKECKNIIEDIPSIDIVRCKECRHCYTDGENVVFNVCELNHNKVQSDEWFCADGEREVE